MLIKRLEMVNFRQFRGKQVIDFADDKTRNITIILGKNTSGKSTLLNAFIWCLYGTNNFETKQLLNKEVEKEMHVGDSEKVHVEITLIHNDTEYVISRNQEYNCTVRGVQSTPESHSQVAYKQADGQTEIVRSKAAKSVINEILPEDLSDYFFFDTEEIEKISNKKDVTEAVKGLLGLSVLNNAMKHLKDNSRSNVIKNFKNKMDMDGGEKVTELKHKIADEEEKREQLLEELNNVKGEIEHYERRKEYLKDIIRDNQTTAALQKDKEKKEVAVKKEESALETTLDNFIKDFNTNIINYFATPLMQKALEVLKNEEIIDKGIRDMTSNSIEDIINRERCICGTVVKEGEMPYTCLLKESEYLPPQSIGTVVRSFRERIYNYHDSSKTYLSKLDVNYKAYLRSKERIFEWNDDILEISEQIKGKENMKKYEDELSDVEATLKRLIEKRDNKKESFDNCSKRIESHQREYDGLSLANEKNKEIQECVSYAEEIYEWIKSAYDEKEMQIRDDLESKVNDIFSKMYHGRRKVIIDEKYRVELLTDYVGEDLKTDRSKGLDTVKNFAFVAGLVELAKNKVISKTSEGDLELGSEPYPLIMDAPFSNADENHVKNIATVLPDIAEQIIIFVMKKDWSHAERVMGSRVGKSYSLDKKSETLTLLEEA